EKGRTQELRRPCIIAPELGGLLFGAQFTYLTHAPQRALAGFLRLKSEIADGVSGPTHNLESFARWRSAFKDSRLAVEQFSQVVTGDRLVHFIHNSHLFPFPVLMRDTGVTHTNYTSKTAKLNCAREPVKPSNGNSVHRSGRRMPVTEETAGRTTRHRESSLIGARGARNGPRGRAEPPARSGYGQAKR